MATRPGYIWSGTEWVSIGQEATVNPFAYQASAPSTPATGDIWVDSDDTVPSVTDVYSKAEADAKYATQATVSVLQTIHTTYTGTFTSSSTTPADVTDFSATITPKSSTSKILVLFNSWVGYSETDTYPYFLLKRNGTSVGAGATASGVRINTFASTPALSRDVTNTQVYKLLHASRSYMDSPATTISLTYQIQFAAGYSGTAHVNRQDYQGDATYVQYPASDIILMEVAG